MNDSCEKSVDEKKRRKRLDGILMKKYEEA